ncbi:capsular biosynthesis protein [Halomonas sp. XH26]|uniref:Capsular biosynthesis protein n=1 Tax=Vreelandella alkaliphila TaxID=272774 RepID=A0AAJ2RX65_9GAMM|nr:MULTISPECIES: capsular biosynthesis protein [Halomonas]AYF34633.1 capsule biosynthesis protein CapA [Halomonas alkaliphila]MCD6003861.1 capsular biosynthesis protein [Halomonas sp. IOP_6]MDX5976642.1 capsular biosynthesis protein [Halomonas alkaliphila]PAU72970.1 capsule biosynthesis protein CapA [Halomonas humidisoli]UTA78596.1 capsular biosynthesis protein [Halomonas sp. XH26]
MKQKRAFLFLQGVCSPFYQRLARRLTDDGHRVVKVNFNAGDIVYWQRTHSQNHLFRGPLSELPAYIQSLWQRYDITDQVLFGDRRPIHRPAVDLASAAGIRTHVFEEGYFRPFWVTLEREGVNGHSLLPRDPKWFFETGKALPKLPAPVRFRSSFKIRAAHDMCYHLAGLANPLVAPHYRNHAPITAPVEYAGYAKRFTLLRYWKKRDAARIKNLIEGGKPYFMLPLQLNTDAQIRDHSPYANMEEVMDHVMGSFALHAPSDALLCIKNHPLDMGLVNYPNIIKRLEDFYGLHGRIVYLESGNLNPLLKHATGTVTVNSTVGIVSLEKQCPTFALSDPIYNLAGLTYEGSLDEFWHQPPLPSQALFGYFRNTVMYTTQINGGFYCQPSIDLAVNNAAGILEACPSPLETLL